MSVPSVSHVHLHSAFFVPPAFSSSTLKHSRNHARCEHGQPRAGGPRRNCYLRATKCVLKWISESNEVGSAQRREVYEVSVHSDKMSLSAAPPGKSSSLKQLSSGSDGDVRLWNPPILRFSGQHCDVCWRLWRAHCLKKRKTHKSVTFFLMIFFFNDKRLTVHLSWQKKVLVKYYSHLIFSTLPILSSHLISSLLLPVSSSLLISAPLSTSHFLSSYFIRSHLLWVYLFYLLIFIFIFISPSYTILPFLSPHFISFHFTSFNLISLINLTSPIYLLISSHLISSHSNLPHLISSHLPPFYLTPFICSSHLISSHTLA